MKRSFQFFLLFFFFSCSIPETHHEFVERFTTVMKKQDQAGLENCFINSKSDIRKMILEGKGRKGMINNYIDQEVDEMYNAIHEDFPRMFRIIRSRTTRGWDKMALVSVEENEKFSKAKIDLPYYKATEIIATYQLEEKPYKVRFRIIDTGRGDWMMIDYAKRMD